jgi:hypothetical protein
VRRHHKMPKCRRCRGRMLIASCSLVCENGCGRLQILPTSERQRLARAFPELVIECVPVSKMRLSSY